MINMDAFVEYGTDINSNWSFTDGDINLISGTDNLSQAIMNRLNTLQDELNLFYSDYGSYLQSFFGWRKNDKTLEFIKVEIDTVVNKDPRVNNFTSEISYNQEGNVNVNLVIMYIDGEDFSLNYVLSNDGVLEV